jgi:4-amino-4-deoxy-L-arabinose transferase-like glycosyltransferase
MQHYIFLYLGLLVIYVLSGMETVPFHGDESTQIYMSRDYIYQFLDRDLSKIYYNPNPSIAAEQELRLLNGTLSKYLIGLAWHLRGFTPLNINEQWDWGADWNYNQTNGHAPSDDLLHISRIPSTILLAVSVVAIFVIGWQVGGLPTAYFASLYYALNPALLLNGRRAMMEGSFICFSLLTVLAGIWLLQRPSWRSTLALGLAAGLALASKHTALFTVAAVFFACAVYIFTRTIRTWRVVPVLIYLRYVLAALLAGIVFLLLNPAWWNDPLGMPGIVLHLREALLARQTAAFGGYANFGDQVAGFLRQSFVVLPQYFEVKGWENFIGDQIARYEASVWRGVSVGGTALGAVILCAIIGVGAWALLRGRKTRLAARWLVGVWALAMLLTTLFLTPIEWQRYYVPIYPVVALLAGLGLSRMVQSVVWSLRHSQRPALPTA